MADSSQYPDSAREIKTEQSKTSRVPVSTRTRFEIFKRDRFTCQYCGSAPPGVLLHVDHILAVKNGGDSLTGNLITACERCNLGKSAVPLNVIPASLEETANRAAEMADQVRAHGEMIRAAHDEAEAMAWAVSEVIQPGAGADGWNRDRFSGVKAFVARIGYAATLEAAYIAESRHPPSTRRFKYFCGICWNRVREKENPL